jgi:hypothetical protein
MSQFYGGFCPCKLHEPILRGILPMQNTTLQVLRSFQKKTISQNLLQALFVFFYQNFDKKHSFFAFAKKKYGRLSAKT